MLPSLVMCALEQCGAVVGGEAGREHHLSKWKEGRDGGELRVCARLACEAKVHLHVPTKAKPLNPHVSPLHCPVGRQSVGVLLCCQQACPVISHSGRSMCGAHPSIVDHSATGRHIAVVQIVCCEEKTNGPEGGRRRWVQCAFWRAPPAAQTPQARELPSSKAAVVGRLAAHATRVAHSSPCTSTHPTH